MSGLLCWKLVKTKAALGSDVVKKGYFVWIVKSFLQSFDGLEQFPKLQICKLKTFTVKYVIKSN